ncbi:hypothetical protein Y1Q_0021123 [Alligator mississippiensis]|uniref:Uncharacterized protein n=1 Tax=Alligator mississippiensis TaxID=8496 RepID=A0A151NRK4_ALLMI|nr:hypothetical protein Y1Q_0021123 [Alligator mississippiensis]
MSSSGWGDGTHVSNQKLMFSTYSELEKTLAIAVSNPMLPKDVIPCLVVRASPDIEVTKEDVAVRLWYRSDHGAEVIVELVLDFVGVGHGRGIRTGDIGRLFAKKEELGHHQSVIHSLWQQINQHNTPEHELIKAYHILLCSDVSGNCHWCLKHKLSLLSTI